jgi:hypothetical protein
MGNEQVNAVATRVQLGDSGDFVVGNFSQTCLNE